MSSLIADYSNKKINAQEGLKIALEMEDADPSSEEVLNFFLREIYSEEMSKNNTIDEDERIYGWSKEREEALEQYEAYYHFAEF